MLHKPRGKTTLDSRMKIYLSIPAANTEHKWYREGRSVVHGSQVERISEFYIFRYSHISHINSTLK